MQFLTQMRLTSNKAYPLVLKGVITLIISYALVNFISCFGCPYSFTGASVPPYLHTIAIPYADDRSGSGEAGLRDLLNQKLTQKFNDDNNLKITDRSNADAVLECIITGLNDAPAVVTGGSNATVSTRRITITVQAIYKDLVKRKTVYDKQFSNYGDYSTDNVDNRNTAIATAIDKISDDILLETVSGW